MNSGRSDASTSTDDDLKNGPLCFFYFTHPFGVWCTEPPQVRRAPAHVASALRSMRPRDPAWPGAAPPGPDGRPDDCRHDLHFNLGNATVHRAPLNVLPLPKPRQYTLDFDLNATSSSFFSTDYWPSSSSRSYDSDRRVIPYNTILPPLRMPSPKDLSDCSDDFWAKKCLNPEKFSLPPIELPRTSELGSDTPISMRTEELCVASSGGARVLKCRSSRDLRCGVRKPARRARDRRSAVRRVLTHLMQRTLKYRKECNSSPALQEVLNTIREAWTEPTLLLERCVASMKLGGVSVRMDRMSGAGGAGTRRLQLAELAAPGASPGLLRRRYSVPETIMRKYRLAQQKSECESAGRDSSASACQRRAQAGAPCGCESAGGGRESAGGGRGSARRAALLRRLWARPCACCQDAGSREARSLGCSRAEIAAGAGPGWATPKRQRLDDDMLRAAMRNSYDDRRLRGDLSDSSYMLHARDASTPLNGSTERLSASSRSERRSRDVFAQYSESEYGAPQTSSLPSPVFNSIPPAAPTYDLLEIVVSETCSGDSPLAINASSPERKSSGGLALFCGSAVDIDQYVSNILVESLNSISDQLESMNASIGGDRKISIVEKEIKVKLQNTGVNTIVHLSPTSNNQIIFGNEELYHAEARRDSCHVPPPAAPHHHNPPSADYNPPSADYNNPPSADYNPPSADYNPPSADYNPPSADYNHNVARADSQRDPEESLTDLSHHESVNRVVLQQIQKLFQDEFDQFEPTEFKQTPTPEISHIEISNVDIYIEDANENNRNIEREQLTVGGGNYFSSCAPLVPRLSALPHSASMEVNTSSSEGDSGPRVSDCTSLVDSLDDPASPRTDLLPCDQYQTRFTSSNIDVLELLPHSDQSDRSGPRSEAFYIRIKDDDCDCEKENIIVADHMPEKIKQRLYRRHRRRELRSRIKQLKRDFEKQRSREAYRSKRDIERECASTLNALINEVIAKIAQDEYKCMRIKRRPSESLNKSTENLARRNRRKDLDRADSRDALKVIDNSSVNFLSKRPEGENLRARRKQIHGKLSLQTKTSPTEDRGPKRIYQKSEIHDGNKRIEILEILEYVVNASQSSPETTTSDENHNCSSRSKKSRIPVPISERNQRLPRACSQSVPSLFRPAAGGLQAGGLQAGGLQAGGLQAGGLPAAGRRASLPQEARFRRVFDAIPEERSSLDSADDAPRRLSAPSLPDRAANYCAKNRPVRSAATSPTNDRGTNTKLRSQMTMTSPCRRSAATSPMQRHSPESGATNRASVATNSSSSGQTSGALSGVTSGVTSGSAASGARGWLETGSKSSKERLDEPSKQTNCRNPASSECAPRPSPGSGARPAAHRPPPRREPAHHTHTSSKAPNGHKNDLKKPKGVPKSDTTESKKKPYKSNAFERSDTKSMQMVRVEGCEGSRGGTGEEEGCSSDSGSGGSLLCALAPRWLQHARHKQRRHQRDQQPHRCRDQQPTGDWSVTVAGSCRAALPANLEMRLRFPDAPRRSPPRSDAPRRAPPRSARDQPPHSLADTPHQECCCRECCTPPRLPPAPAPHARDQGKLTFSMKKEALDSSILASKSRKKSREALPELEVYRAARTRTNSSVKTRRGYSLRCWLPSATTSRSKNALSVLGSAIVPETKPRAPTMSERDLTRLYTPRLYLRS